SARRARHALGPDSAALILALEQGLMRRSRDPGRDALAGPRVRPSDAMTRCAISRLGEPPPLSAHRCNPEGAQLGDLKGGARTPSDQGERASGAKWSRTTSALIAERYGLQIEPELASILPPEPEW